MDKLKDKVVKLKEKAEENEKLRKENQELQDKLKEYEVKKADEALKLPPAIVEKADEQAQQVLEIKKVQPKQFTDNYILLWKNVLGLNKKIDLAISLYNQNPKEQLEFVKEDFTSYVDKFNSLKSQLVEIKILDKIIDYNNQQTANNNIPPDLINNRADLLFKFNSIFNELKNCSNKLKDFLILIHLDDIRLPVCGFLNGIMNAFYAKARIFDLPGGENLVVNEKLNTLPQEWVYIASVAYVKKEEGQAKEDVKTDEIEKETTSKTEENSQK